MNMRLLTGCKGDLLEMASVACQQHDISSSSNSELTTYWVCNDPDIST